MGMNQLACKLTLVSPIDVVNEVQTYHDSDIPKDVAHSVYATNGRVGKDNGTSNHVERLCQQ